MRVLITGGGGFIGKKLAARLLELGELNGGKLERVTLFDVMPAEGLPADPRLEIVAGDITRPGVIFDLVRPGHDAVYHLAAVVSGAAEADIDLGYAVNLDGTRHLLDAVRAFAQKPRFVFASSCAVFGGALPDVLGDDTPLTPQTSYGAQKAMGELLVADFHRTLLKGGVFLYPPTEDFPDGKLRLLYEANPVAFLAEQAGGTAIDGTKRILDIEPTSIHQRTPLVVGSRVELADFERFVLRGEG